MSEARLLGDVDARDVVRPRSTLGTFDSVSAAGVGIGAADLAESDSRVGDYDTVDFAHTPSLREYVPGFLALTKTAIGSGVLGLPFALRSTGWLVGCIVMLATWCGSLVGQSLLFKCAFRAGGRHTSWYSLARRSYTWLPVLVDAAIAFKCIGVSVSYMIVMRTLMPAALRTFGVAADSWAASKTFWIVVVGAFVVLPLTSLKNIDALKYSSALGLVAVLYVAVLVVVYALVPTAMDACAQVACHVGIEAGAASFADVLAAIPTFVFAFQCNTSVFLIFNEAANNRPKFTIWRCAVPCHVVMLSIDAAVAYAGYILYGSNIASNVLSGNFPPQSVSVALARLLISVAVVMSIPLQLFPARVCLLSLVDGARRQCGRKRFLTDADEPVVAFAGPEVAAEQTRDSTYWAVTMMSVVLACVLSYIVDSLGLVYEIVGATAAVMMSYILPGLYTLALFSDSMRLSRIGFAYAAFGLLLMLFSLYGAIKKAI